MIKLRLPLADAALQQEVRKRWFSLLGLLTGMRLDEIVHLQPKVIHRDQRQIVVEWGQIRERLIAAAAGSPPSRSRRPQPIALMFTTRAPGRRSLPTM